MLVSVDSSPFTLFVHTRSKEFIFKYSRKYFAFSVGAGIKASGAV